MPGLKLDIIVDAKGGVAQVKQFGDETDAAFRKAGRAVSKVSTEALPAQERAVVKVRQKYQGLLAEVDRLEKSGRISSTMAANWHQAIGVRMNADLAKLGDTGASTMARIKHGVESINWRAMAAGVALVTGAVAMAARQAIAGASDLEETTSKFEVVFAGQEQAAYQMASTLRDSYAMSNREARQYLASIQDLLVPMGMARDSAARMSGEVVKLAADLGSFNNLPTAEVMKNIQSALVGEFEPMRKYGVVLSAATIQHRALTMGLAKTKDELTAGDKAQAAYAMMVDASAAALGDMARTADSYANQQKKLKANQEDINATLGTHFLPVAKAVTGEINHWVAANENLLAQDMEAWAKTAVYGMSMVADVGRGVWVTFDTIGKSVAMVAAGLIKLSQATGAIMAFNFTDAKAALTELQGMASAYGADIEKTYSRKSFTQSVYEHYGTKKKTGQPAAAPHGSAPVAPTTPVDLTTTKTIEAIAKAEDAAFKKSAAALDNLTLAALPANERAVEKVRLQYEQMNAQVEQLYIIGEISKEQADEFHAALGTRMQEDLDKLADKTDTTAKAMEQAFSGWANGFSGDLNNMLWDANATFDGILESFGRMVTQMMIQQSIVEPFVKGVTGSGLFGSIGSLFGGSSALAGGGAVDVADLYGGGKAVGGSTAPGMFYEVNENGPELYSTGGKTYLMTGSQGGYVTPASSGGGGGASSPHAINIINKTSTPIKQDNVRVAGNGRSITVELVEVVDKAIAGGRFNRSMSAAYGLQPATGRF